MVQAALNGTRTRADHHAIPLTPVEQATEVRASVAAGGSDSYPRADVDGHESLANADVAQAVDAIRLACPGTPVGHRNWARGSFRT
jgi:uncharacterized protein (DUF849 family)